MGRVVRLETSEAAVSFEWKGKVYPAREFGIDMQLAVSDEQSKLQRVTNRMIALNKTKEKLLSELANLYEQEESEAEIAKLEARVDALEVKLKELTVESHRGMSVMLAMSLEGMTEEVAMEMPFRVRSQVWQNINSSLEDMQAEAVELTQEGEKAASQ